MFRETNPLKEFTGSEAIALPVIEGVDSIYLLDTRDTEKIEDEGSGDISVLGGNVTKQELVDALISMNVSASMKQSLATLQKTVSGLSNAKKEELKKLLNIS
jgi:hypothetical protein